MNDKTIGEIQQQVLIVLERQALLAQVYEDSCLHELSKARIGDSALWRDWAMAKWMSAAHEADAAFLLYRAAR